MRLRRTLALAAAALLPLTVGLTEATAVQPPAPVSTVITADDDADDVETTATDLTHPLRATNAGQPNYLTCRDYGYGLGETCFQWEGDVSWVRDLAENGWATVFHIQTNYGKDRYCQAPSKADGWGYCNYDHREGKCVRWRLYELKDGVTRNGTLFSPWYGTEYGSPC